MSNDVFVITEHMDGTFSDVSFELVGKTKELASALGGQAVAVVVGSGVDANVFASDSTIHVDDAALSQFNPEAYGKVVEALVKEKSPRLVLFGWTAAGMDLAAWLSARLGVPCAAYVKEIGADLTMSCQAYGGKLTAEVAPEGDMAIAACLAGSIKVKFIEAIKPEGSDVDITAQDKLVSVGRGIGGKENIELAEELAEALGAALSCSRPVVDAGWLPRTRQVGKSGLKVKPKMYLMLGISGAPEHLEGMKSAELIIAVNTDKKAPIFNVAHYGATADLFEVAEEMLELL